MAKHPAKKRKRLLIGRDFDVWAWRWDSGYWSQRVRPIQQSERPKKPEGTLGGGGKWVRVKFKEVK